MDDVVIVGAGPAGSLAAIILSRAGLRVRVFDRARFPRLKLCGDTLNPGALRTLARLVSIDTLRTSALPIDGMLLTGPGGVSVRGLYGGGISGHAVERRVLDQWLLDRAVESGACVEQECAADAVITDGEHVTGVRVRTRQRSTRVPARIVIAADGRHSRLAFTAGLAQHPPQPRRWAIGAYFEGVEGRSTLGEMHVRTGHYIGVAPMPGGLTNACLVVPLEQGGATWRDAAALLTARLRQDPVLGARVASARMVEAPAILGPMAVDVRTPGLPGLLLAGDAAGFIDPITGDGLTFALRGAEMAAEVALDVLAGKTRAESAVHELARRRREAFAAKWRVNRSLRRLVASPHAVNVAAGAARIAPRMFQAIIRYAGDAT
jgi:menaquinone-9 beta-reductase